MQAKLKVGALSRLHARALSHERPGVGHDSLETIVRIERRCSMVRRLQPEGRAIGDVDLTLLPALLPSIHAQRDYNRSAQGGSTHFTCHNVKRQPTAPPYAENTARGHESTNEYKNRLSKYFLIHYHLHRTRVSFRSAFRSARSQCHTTRRDDQTLTIQAPGTLNAYSVWSGEPERSERAERSSLVMALVYSLPQPYNIASSIALQHDVNTSRLWSPLALKTLRLFDPYTRAPSSDLAVGGSC